MQRTPTILTSSEAARRLHVSDTTVRRWIASGQLPAFRTIGGHARICLGDVKNLMRDLGW